MTLSYISILLWSYLTVSDTHISFPHGDQSVARLAKADYIVNLAAGVCPIYTYIPLASGYESLWNWSTLKVVCFPCTFILNKIRNWMQMIARSYCADFGGTNGHLHMSKLAEILNPNETNEDTLMLQKLWETVILRVSAFKISFETGARILQMVLFPNVKGLLTTPTTIHRGPLGGFRYTLSIYIYNIQMGM